MTMLAAGVDYVDLEFLGFPEIIATAIIHGPSGVALIDPGPSTTAANLKAALERKGIRMADVRQILLTHIHLDHAGAVGTLVRDNPRIQVLVHERGARHMVAPEKLLSSAARLYGSDMERLWGEFLPVPQDRITVLVGGEIISVGGRDLEVAYTPGHASHHVSFFDPSSRIAFVGDVAGIRRGPRLCVMPPTPPPDIDLEAWSRSEDRILAWEPDTLFLTHFGPFHGARLHLTDMTERLAFWSRIVRNLLADQALDENQKLLAFLDEAMLELRRKVGEQEAEQYARAGRLDYSWQGLARYWTKKFTPS
jgi:glyoxylase-like metal-dependent hydrolase (beta-lactamase superfamily II)